VRTLHRLTKKSDFKIYTSISKLHALVVRFIILEKINDNNREIVNNIHTIHWINFPLLSSFKIEKMVTAKIKATTTVHKFLLAHNSRNPYFGRTKSLFIQKKQTNCYLIVVTLRLGLSSQVTRAHFVSTHVIFPLLFSIASKDLQYWLAFKTPDWLSNVELSCHVYLLTMLLHHSTIIHPK
jgi:hypothetical protein